MTVRRPQLLRSPLALIAIAVTCWFALAFLIVPNTALLWQTFAPAGEPSLRAVEKLISSERAMRALGNSFLLAAVLSVTVNIVGVFIVLVTGYYRVRGARLLWLGYATTFIYGGIVLAAGYKAVYGENGPLTRVLRMIVPGLPEDWFSGFLAVVFVMTLATTTNHMLFLRPALARVDQQTVEAARGMGASEWTILRTVVFPVLMPVLFAVTILSFLTGLGALSAPQVLGGQEFQTIAPMILSFSASATSRDIAALLAILLGVATILLLAFMLRLERGRTFFSVSKVSVALQRRPLPNRTASIVVHVLAYALFFLYVAPVVVIVLSSFMPPETVARGELSLALTLENYLRVLGQDGSLRPLLVSIGYSGAAALIVVFGLIIVTRVLTAFPGRISSVIEYLLHIPWILPATMIALGLIMSYDRPNPLVGGRVLTGTAWILLIAYVLVKIPFTLRLLKAAFLSIDSSKEEAARLMGAGPLRTYRAVILPVILPTALAVGALNFTALLDDYDVAVFLAHPLLQPLGLVIKANSESSATLHARADTFVYTVLLMVITGITMYLVYGRGTAGRRPGERR